MRLLGAAQSRALDETAAAGHEALVKSAGIAVAKTVEKLNPQVLSVLILVGPGSNGLDGRIAGEYLRSRNIRTATLEIPQIETLAQMELWDLLNKVDVVIDAMFGTGLSRDLSAGVVRAIEILNKSRKPILAVDLPSGLNADTGRAMPIAVKARWTLSFGLLKPGQLIEQGPEHCGRTFCEPLLFTKEERRLFSGTYFTFEQPQARALLPVREATDNKSSSGRVQIFAGSVKYPGAAILCATAAARAGAGYTRLVSGAALKKLVAPMPEVIFVSKPEIDPEQTYVLGPGFTDHALLRKTILGLIAAGCEKVILDAEAIVACVKFNLFPLPPTWIWTPHPGELGRVFGLSATDIVQDRPGFALRAAREFGGVVLVKGFRTVVSDGHRCLIVMAGNAALAKGGSGDVLSGMTGAFRNHVQSPLLCAALGAYVHGRLADEWVESGRDVLSLLPTDLAEFLPELLARLRA